MLVYGCFQTLISVLQLLIWEKEVSHIAVYYLLPTLFIVIVFISVRRPLNKDPHELLNLDDANLLCPRPRCRKAGFVFLVTIIVNT